MGAFTKKNIIIIAIGIVILLTTILTSVFYTSKQENSIQKTDESDDRNTNISQTFTEFMGEYWPYLLLMLYILFAIISLLIYLLIVNKNEPTTINVSDKTGKILNISLISVGVLAALAITGLSASAYINDVQNNKNISPYEEADNKKQRTEFIQVILLVTIVLIALTFATKFLINFLKK